MKKPNCSLLKVKGCSLQATTNIKSLFPCPKEQGDSDRQKSGIVYKISCTYSLHWGIFLKHERWITLRCCHLGQKSRSGLERVKINTMPRERMTGWEIREPNLLKSALAHEKCLHCRLLHTIVNYGQTERPEMGSTKWQWQVSITTPKFQAMSTFLATTWTLKTSRLLVLKLGNAGNDHIIIPEAYKGIGQA